MSDAWLDEVPWDDRGLVPAIAQEAGTGRVLMFAWMNREALERHGAPRARRTTGRVRATGSGTRARNPATSSE